MFIKKDKMKVLWFVQENFDPSKEKGGYNGAGWISSLRNELVKKEGIEMALAFFSKECKQGIANGVTYYSMLTPTLPSLKKIAFRFKRNFIKEEEALWPDYRAEMLKVLCDFKPDVIQIFGSENKYGLVASVTDIPIVLHIQGIVNPYLNAYLPPFVSKLDYYLKDGFNPLKLIKNIFQLYNWKMLAHCEREILKNIQFYFGRTTWDYRIVKLFNSNATYFHCDEILRSSFYDENMKRRIPSKLKIVSTISIPPYKGFDIILKTAKLLCSMNVDFEWNVFGNVGPNLIEKNARIRHEDVHVNLMGVATETQIKETILSSTVYVHPSYIDNSPNSVCEAQMCGVPVIATNVGGVSSLIENGKTGFLVPANDPYQMAYLVNELGCNLDLNVKIGEGAKAMAFERHNRNHICENLYNNYCKIIK